MLSLKNVGDYAKKSSARKVYNIVDSLHAMRSQIDEKKDDFNLADRCVIAKAKILHDFSLVQRVHFLHKNKIANVSKFHFITEQIDSETIKFQYIDLNSYSEDSEIVQNILHAIYEKLASGYTMKDILIEEQVKTIFYNNVKKKIRHFYTIVNSNSKEILANVSDEELYNSYTNNKIVDLAVKHRVHPAAIYKELYRRLAVERLKTKREAFKHAIVILGKGKKTNNFYVAKHGTRQKYEYIGILQQKIDEIREHLKQKHDLLEKVKQIENEKENIKQKINTMRKTRNENIKNHLGKLV